MTNEAIIFTDGTCLGNPGPGGYAAVITIAGEEQIIVGRDLTTTNNKMEMTAAIKALEAVPQGLPIVLHSDSQYVIKGATEWLRGWKAKGWRKASTKPRPMDADGCRDGGSEDHLEVGEGSCRSP
jgi:ribonuclease HI